MTKEFHFRLWQTDKPLLSHCDRWRKQAQLLKLSKKARHKLEWFIYYHERSGKNARKTARYFGITAKTFYKWFAVFDPQNLRALEEASRAPMRTRRHIVNPSIEKRIVQLRRANPEFGKMKLKALYETLSSEVISSWQVQLIIEKYHLQRRPSGRSQRFKKHSISKRRTNQLQKKQQVGFLVAFDTIEVNRNGVRRYIVTGIDTVSKIAWARMYSTHSSATTKDLFQRLYAIIHGNILNICSDNGSEFEKHFAEAIASLNIPHYFSRVKTPKDNPVCERFNGTLKREFLRMGNWTTGIAEFNKRLTAWLLKYNCVRPHQSLNYQTPFAFAFNHPAVVTDVVI